MPVTRKSTRSRGGAAATQGKQQTLSFNHRVTKPTAKTGKDLLVKEESTPETITTKTKDVKIEDDNEVVEVPASEPESEAEEEPQAKVKPAKKTAPKDLKKETKEEVKETKAEEPERSEVEKRALKLPQSAIDAYWHNIDSARMARAVHKKHTEGLTTGEKVLRYFDVSSHYGVSFFLSSLFGTSHYFFTLRPVSALCHSWGRMETGAWLTITKSNSPALESPASSAGKELRDWD